MIRDGFLKEVDFKLGCERWVKLLESRQKVEGIVGKGPCRSKSGLMGANK